AGDIEQIYRRAIQRFQDRSWWHKLARFYLRNRLANDLRTLSRQVVDTFAGTDVEAYIADVIADAALERRLQLEINLYAHTRFPHDLRFVQNLISLYSVDVTADSAALTRLLADHWYEDEGIRRMYFERLSAAGALAGADREIMTTARSVWARLPGIEPGKPEGYLQAATLFWDYLSPSDALNWLQRGRARLKDPSLWAYETGAILESQNRRPEAVAEYIK